VDRLVGFRLCGMVAVYKICCAAGTYLSDYKTCYLYIRYVVLLVPTYQSIRHGTPIPPYVSAAGVDNCHNMMK